MGLLRVLVILTVTVHCVVASSEKTTLIPDEDLPNAHPDDGNTFFLEEDVTTKLVSGWDCER